MTEIGVANETSLFLLLLGVLSLGVECLVGIHAACPIFDGMKTMRAIPWTHNDVTQ